MDITEVPAKLESMLAIIDRGRELLDEQIQSGVPFDRSIADSIAKLSTAHANLSRESLRWLAKAKSNASSSGLEARKEGVLGFITSLPVSERKSLYEALVAFEATAAPNLPLSL